MERVAGLCFEHFNRGGGVMLPFWEDLALVRLIGFSELLREVALGRGNPSLVEPQKAIAVRSRN